MVEVFETGLFLGVFHLIHGEAAVALVGVAY